MPANIAHMLICNKAVKVLEGNGGKYQQFIDIINSNEYKPYLHLGSLVPGLSYCRSKLGGLINLIVGSLTTSSLISLTLPKRNGMLFVRGSLSLSGRGLRKQRAGNIIVL